jgi:hypothetical protein
VSTSAGATLFYRPSLKLNGSLSYDYAKDLYDRHVGGADVFYRPTPQLDIMGSARALLLDLDQTQILSGSASTTIAYRPMLNLTTTLFSTLGATQTSTSVADSRAFFQNYGASVSYFTLYDLVRVNTGAGLGVGNVIATGHSNTTFNSNWMAQATNTKTQYVTTTGSYHGFYQQTGGGADLWTNTIRADATSSYFRELLLRGDTATLHAGAGDVWTMGPSQNDQLIDFGVDAHYGWQAVGIGSGYTTRITTSQDEDYDAYFVEGQWTVPPVLSGLSLMVHGRYDEQLMNTRTQSNHTTTTAGVNGSYQIGRVQLNLMYQFNSIDSGSSTLSHNLLLRLTRRFSL